jgi:hypothetical protein
MVFSAKYESYQTLILVWEIAAKSRGNISPMTGRYKNVGPQKPHGVRPIRGRKSSRKGQTRLKTGYLGTQVD